MEENQEQLDLQSIENVSEATLATAISEGIKYDFTKSFLVKQLEPTMLTRIVKVPVKTEELDEDGVPLMEMTEEEQEVESVLRTGIILKIPASMINTQSALTYSIGDRIVYRNMRATDFDLYKDAALVDPFDVICKASA